MQKMRTNMTSDKMQANNHKTKMEGDDSYTEWRKWKLGMHDSMLTTLAYPAMIFQFFFT